MERILIIEDEEKIARFIELELKFEVIKLRRLLKEGRAWRWRKPSPLT